MKNSFIKSKLKANIPEFLWVFFRNKRNRIHQLLLIICAFLNPLHYTTIQNFYFLYIQWRYKIIVQRLRNKDNINVAFFLIHETIWKYEGIYQLMVEHERFKPIVVVCPYISFGREAMLDEMKRAYKSFKNKGYNVIMSYNEETGKWLDVKKELQPDIVFFTNPHKLTTDKYFITNYLGCLTCYVQYSFTIAHTNSIIYDQIFHNLLWKAFYETKIHKTLAIKYSRNKGLNVEITGYPGVDKLTKGSYIAVDSWKNCNQKLKRVIWAPHHTIENDGLLNYSNFLQYSDLMLEIAKNKQNTIQIAFKPHPILKQKLYKHVLWGKARTNEYFTKWESLINGQLEESDYLDLFLTSDAMIHDSGSFMTEYLYTGKPVLFTVRDRYIKERFNSFGQMVFEQLYQAFNAEDVINFIENIVINENDYLKNLRQEFYNNYLKVPNNKTASENIFEIVLNKLTI